jgi:hypothetical protein
MLYEPPLKVFITDLKIFWQHTFRIPRIAFVLAGSAVVAHVLSLLGFGFEDTYYVPAVIHVGVMVLGFNAILKRIQKSYFKLRYDTRFPRGMTHTSARMIFVLVLLGLYTAAWFFGVFLAYGEGRPAYEQGQYLWKIGNQAIRPGSLHEYTVFQARALSVFSAAWMFAALGEAIFIDRTLRYIKYVREEKSRKYSDRKRHAYKDTRFQGVYPLGSHHNHCLNGN